MAKMNVSSEFKTVRTWPFAWRFGLWWALLLAGLSIAVADTPLWFCGSLLTGAMLAHALELCHQCLHFGAVRSKPANRVIGIILATPMLVSFSRWQFIHNAQHHRDVRIEGFEYRYDQIGTLSGLVRHMLLISHHCQAIRSVVMAFQSHRDWGFSPRRNAKISVEYKIGAIFLGCVLLTIPYFGPLIFAKVYLVPIIIGSIIHAAIELPEHIFCETGNPDPSANSRNIISGPITTWFVHFNNFHATHHYFPSVPSEMLPATQSTYRPHLKFNSSSYIQFYREFSRKWIETSRKDKRCT